MDIPTCYCWFLRYPSHCRQIRGGTYVCYFLTSCYKSNRRIMSSQYLALKRAVCQRASSSLVLNDLCKVKPLARGFTIFPETGNTPTARLFKSSRSASSVLVLANARHGLKGPLLMSCVGWSAFCMCFFGFICAATLQNLFSPQSTPRKAYAPSPLLHTLKPRKANL